MIIIKGVSSVLKKGMALEEKGMARYQQLVTLIMIMIIEIEFAKFHCKSLEMI